MNNILLIGPADASSIYIDKYIEHGNFLPYEIEKYDGKIKIEDARAIKKSLSFKVSGKKLFVLMGEITIEAQNALLKSIEEAGDNVFFILGVTNVNNVLPTVGSRCKMVNCGGIVSETIFDNKNSLYELVEKAAASHPDWSCVEKISETLEGKGLRDLLAVLRTALLDDITNRLYFKYSKRLLALLPLVEKNNVNQKMALESIFLN